MGWSIGYDDNWQRDIGYGVPAFCDHPGCGAKIDRGLAHVCGGEPYGGEHGCGLHFCGDHIAGMNNQCERCRQQQLPFDPTPDHRTWIAHKLTDATWQPWRDANPADVAKLKASMQAARTTAPWPDFAGNPIHEGDVIAHPSGERGRVVLLAGERDPGDQWRVDYGTGDLSRLCLQIGDKGRAVVTTDPTGDHVPDLHQ